MGKISKSAILLGTIISCVFACAKFNISQSDSSEMETPPNSRQSNQNITWNANMKIEFRPIGVVHSAFKEQQGTPIQPVFAQNARGKVEIFEPYRAALKDLNGFSRVWLIYYFDRAKTWEPLVVPYRDVHQRGLFATRAPARPNAIGISAVKLVLVEQGAIEVEEIDVLDGTPVLDIKPYVPNFDSYPDEKAGWLDNGPVNKKTADERFDKNQK
jgi:tRNA (adenine37-N6)-methyltransferase